MQRREQLCRLDSEGNVGQYTSIGIGVDGNPVISYYEISFGNLSVAGHRPVRAPDLMGGEDEPPPAGAGGEAVLVAIPS